MDLLLKKVKHLLLYLGGHSMAVFKVGDKVFSNQTGISIIDDIRQGQIIIGRYSFELDGRLLKGDKHPSIITFDEFRRLIFRENK